MTTATDQHPQELEKCRNQLRQRERELEEVRRQLEGMGRLQAAFLSRVSHDLRAPMNAIVGYARLLLRRAGPNLDERQHRNLENIQTSAHQLLGLIDDIAELSRAEAGRAPIRLRDADVGCLVDACLAAATPGLGPGVQLRHHAEVALTVHTDPERLAVVLDGLLKHAAGGASGGHVVIRAQRAHAGVEIAVNAPSSAPAGPAPPGSGSARPAPGAFEDAGPADGPRLGAVRRLVEALGGTLSVTNADGAGTTFAVLLPCGRP